MILLKPIKLLKSCRVFATVFMLLAISSDVARTAEGILDFDRFKSQIEPLLTTQTYDNPGPGPMTCVACHGDPTHAAYSAYPIRLGESRDNFTEAGRRVRINTPATSLLLLKPLSIVAGGVSHGLMGNDGGEQFANTTTDPAYLKIFSWIVDASKSSQGARVSKTLTYPNPFRFGTHIVYFLTTTALQVEIRVFGSDGHEVRKFVGTTNVGANQVYWDGRDAESEPLPTGVYFYSVKAQFEDGSSLKSGRCVFTP